MINLYLITGFLGAGKTSFLKAMIRQMPDVRLKVIVNEFGKEGIDGALLKNSGVEVEEINNGSIFCSCRIDQFEETLKKVAAEEPDVLWVEASGLSDPTPIEKVLTEIEGFEQIAYRGSICLVDAVNFKKVFSTARVCKKQIAVNSIVLINKIDLVSEAEVDEVERMIREQKPDARIYKTVYGQIDLSWIEGQGAVAAKSAEPAYHLKDVSLQKMRIVLKDTLTYALLKNFLKMFIDTTYRIKGFVCLEGRVSLVDCVGQKLSITPYRGETAHCNTIVALSGAGMPMEQSIRKAAEVYSPYLEKVEWE
jgi:G3E family GTPase